MGLDKKIENVQKFRVDKSKRAGNSGGDKPLPLIPHHSSIPFFSFSFSFLFFFKTASLFSFAIFHFHANNIRSPFGIINPLTH